MFHSRKAAQPILAVRCLAVLLMALTSITLFTSRLSAQTDTGRVGGSVVDDTGAVISGAEITLTNLGTGVAIAAKSDAEGNFNFSAIQPGNYRIQVRATGFDSEQQSFALEVSQVRAATFHLKPGAVSTTITVTDAVPLVDTSTSSTGTVIQGRQVTELPLNGRNFTQLALLVPGITRGAYGSDAEGLNGNAETWRYSETGGAALSANGLRQQANNFELDGLDNNDALVNTIIFMTPVDDTQEFRVTNSVAPAEFGRAGGAIVQNSIKSGTDEFHGSAFLFDRDQIFDASPNYFSPTTPAPSFHRTQFGGSLGGPIWKHHLFMFGGYQGLRQKQPEGLAFNPVPTALERTGNFSELLTDSQSGITTSVPNQQVTGCATTAGPNGTIYDPLTCQAFPHNTILQSRMNQAALNYLNAFPLPNNGPAQGNYSLQNNYVSDPSMIQRYDDFDVRLDWKATSRDSLFGRYSYGEDVQIKQSQFPNLPAGYGSGYNPVHPRGEAVGYTHVFSPNMVNEFRYGHIYDFYGYEPPMENIPVSANLGILNANRNALLGGGAAINGDWPDLAYTGDGGPYVVPQSANQFVDSLSWTRGQHTFKFGASIEQRQVSYCCATDAKGYFSYTQDFTGFAQSDMLAGFVNDYSIGVASNYFVTRNWETGYFAQDDWKATRRLTLNLGLRYDLYTYPYEIHNYQSTFDLTTQTLEVAGTDGLSNSIVQTNKNNFAPRIGFAYDVFGDGKTALRGGYGIYYFLDRGGINNQLSDNPDFNGAASYSDAPTQGNYRNTFTGQAPQGDNNNLDATQKLPLPTFGSTVNRAYPINASLISIDTHLPTSMIQEWNLQLQRQLTQSTSLNIAYVGTSSQHLRTFFNLNSQVFDEAPNTFLYQPFSTINRITANGASNYNGLQVFLNSMMHHGIQYTAAYTWSHALDDSSGAYNTGTTGAGIFILPTGPNFKANYGNSDQDQRQVFTLSVLGELPFGRGKMFASHIPLPLDEAIGGWHLNLIASLESGTPITVTTGDYFYDAPGGTTSLPGASVTNRADIVKPVHYTKSLHEWFDTTAFVHPPALDADGQTSTFTRPGTLGRNQMFGPGYRDVDLSLFKDFPFANKVTGQFRAEAFNLTNTPAFTNPNGDLDNCSYSGAITATCAPNLASDSGSFGQINGTRDHSERQLQLAVRFTF